MGRIAAFLMNVPVRVHTFHGHTFYGYFNKVKNAILLTIERLLALTTTRIVAISSLQKRDLTEKYKVASKKKCEVIQLGLDLDGYLKINPVENKKKILDSRNTDIIIAAVGRITNVKNHRFFVDIAKLFYEKNKEANVKFAIVGGGELKDEIEEYKNSLGLSNKVCLLGWQDNMAEIYSGIDIFALTSKNEGTPVSMIEAMASGLPVVSTNVGGVSDLIEDGVSGYPISDFNKEEFVSKLEKLASDKDLRLALGKNGRIKVRNIFTKEILKANIESLYERLLKERGKK